MGVINQLMTGGHHLVHTLLITSNLLTPSSPKEDVENTTCPPLKPWFLQHFDRKQKCLNALFLVCGFPRNERVFFSLEIAVNYACVKLKRTETLARL